MTTGRGGVKTCPLVDVVYRSYRVFYRKIDGGDRMVFVIIRVFLGRKIGDHIGKGGVKNVSFG